MNQRRSTALLVAWLCLSLCAGAAVKNSAIRVTVLDSQSRSVMLDGSGVPKNCDGVNYDAYCNSSKTQQTTNQLLVQAGSQPPFWVSCTIETRWSRCAELPIGESFNARQEKRGISIYFQDDNGKVRRQLYSYVGDGPAGNLETAASAPDFPARVPASPTQPSPKTAERPAQAAESRLTTDEVVRCSFDSTPAGAEITVDGKFVGSSPSVLSLSVGTHEVEVSLPGFALWKRQLAVSRGSDLTVKAVLEKAQ